MNMSWQYITISHPLLLLPRAALHSVAFGKTDDRQTASVYSMLNAWLPKTIHTQTPCRPQRRASQMALACYQVVFLHICSRVSVFVSSSSKTMLVSMALSVCITAANWAFFATISDMNVGS